MTLIKTTGKRQRNVPVLITSTKILTDKVGKRVM